MKTVVRERRTETYQSLSRALTHHRDANPMPLEEEGGVLTIPPRRLVSCHTKLHNLCNWKSYIK